MIDTTDSAMASPVAECAWQPALWARVLLTLLSVALLIVCFPPYNRWWLAWFALVPLLLAFEGAKAHQARLLGMLWGFVFYGVSVRWMFGIFGFPAVALIGLLALGPWLFGHLYMTARHRLPGAWSWIAIPILWVGVEYFRSECWYFKFAWFGLGYSQIAERGLGQFWWAIISVWPWLAGSYCLSAIVVATSAVLVRALQAPDARRAGRLALPWALGLAAATAVLAPCSVERPRLSERNRRVALVQDESSDLDTAIELSRKAAARSPKLVVWPEYSIMDDPVADAATGQAISALARELNAHVVVGCKRYLDASRKKAYNAALVFDPLGDLVGEYHKANPVQFFDDGVPGKSFPVFDTPLGKLGIAICYDMDFPEVMRKLVQNGAQVLAVPTYDAMWWGELQHVQHSAMTAMRAVEHRRWILRAASSGESQLVSPTGRVEDRLPIGESGVLVGDVGPSPSTLTLYDRGGWLLAPICLALTCALLLWDIVARLKEKRRERPV